MKVKFFIGWLLILMIGFFEPVQASHIIGGEFRYTCLNNQVETNFIRYNVQFTIYMDCKDGQPGAIQREDSGFFRIYNARTKQAIRDIGVFRDTKDIIPTEFSNICVNNPPVTCLLKNTYSFTITLPNDTSGYIIATNNCCRNESVENLINPGLTGASYYVNIPGRPLCNNSAYFKNLPPQIICVNNPFIYDHSAIDPDGDSLSYAFGPAYNAKITTSGNQVYAEFTPPPYNPVNYNFGYTAQKPIPGNPPFQINSTTGIISATPSLFGRYVVAVYCYEWRNGKLINTNVREFQFVITDCSKAVVANIPQYSDEFNTYIVECSSFTVFFENLSQGGNSYFWDFGVEEMDNDTSNEWEPTFNYPDTGTYVVKLVVNRGTTCPDSIVRFVKVFPFFEGDYSYNGLPCPNAPISFRDSSIGNSGAPNYWQWNFGDGSTSNEQNPIHYYREGGEYNVVLISKNQRGCSDTVTRQVDIERFRPFAGNDTVIVKGETMNFNAQGGSIYSWTPSTNLSDPFINNPAGYYPDTGHFEYNVYIRSAGGCEGNDSIKVWVVNQSSIFVPTAFSPNGDGRNETLRPLGVGYRTINYFRIYNRFGQQVFYTTKFNEGWDGRFKGVPQDVGTYFWVLSITNRFGKEELVKGDAILLR